ncbi:phytoene desaturase family protein [Sphingobacterium sp. HJSM2_6]|uniref:phytoene desaturase family protein n=1 Tax=Sphingobacterium sp. HJSM2_6 TaxID=3366264 RepID=UPI003BD0F4AB
MKSYDAIIIGSGPNGLAAAITLQQQGLSTLIIEGANSVGGGMRTEELTLPGYQHDVCSAIHPLFFISSFFKKLSLEKFGLTFTNAPFELAHPMEDGPAAILHRNIADMEAELGIDGPRYLDLINPYLLNWKTLSNDILGPLRIPKNPWLMAKFGIKALQSAEKLSHVFKTEKAKALWAGLVAHGVQPFDQLSSAAAGLILATAGHDQGWPIPIGGSKAIAQALAGYYQSINGEIQLNYWVEDIRALPAHKVLVLDLIPQQMLELKGLKWSASYQKELSKFKQSMGIFKVDWALSSPAAFKDERCRQAATVHIGRGYRAIANYENATNQGNIGDEPFVLYSQPSQFDASRSPAGKHIGWAYCHVPLGSTVDFTSRIENQMERFAPGFKDSILGKSTMNTLQLQAYNPNYRAGDISGGSMHLSQLFTRPSKRIVPYRTSNPNIYIGSSSTPPGGGVHGLCGYFAAKVALKDHFNIYLKD